MQYTCKLYNSKRVLSDAYSTQKWARKSSFLEALRIKQIGVAVRLLKTYSCHMTKLESAKSKYPISEICKGRRVGVQMVQDVV